MSYSPTTKERCPVVTVADVAQHIEQLAPLSYQEGYDNAGLQVGSASWGVSSVLVALDVTPEVVDEAVAHGANMIVAHHPLIFSGLKHLTGANHVQRAVMSAIKHDVAIYAAHTNLDSAPFGLSHAIAGRLGLERTQVLRPQHHGQLKLVTFVPPAHLEPVRAAMFGAGAGCIGTSYDCCSYGSDGRGTFRATPGASPFVGRVGELHSEPETRLEVLLPRHLQRSVVDALLQAHPYEEVAYDLIALENPNPTVGLGMVGDLPEPMESTEFLHQLKRTFGAPSLRHTPPLRPTLRRVAFCGGSGVDMLREAIAQRADAFVTSDIKYHQFFDADGQLMLVDIGHHEIERCAIDLLIEHISKKFTTFAVRKTEVDTNPVHYI